MTGTPQWPQIEALYRSDFARFVRVARAIAGDQEVALEAVQEGFADALRNAGQWNGRGSLEGWVWSCVVNRARKAHRRPITEAWSDNHDNGSDARGDVDLRVLLVALPERQRLAVFLRYFADLEYREIASALGIEVGTVSATLHSAHAALRESLKEVGV